ncbi:thioesterase domain-containing protein [Streptomyces sp. OM5714]|uniref:thioesterase domain-containing protein n=1 Tax=Streptomyces sp. OM5714 TaxID=2602736 RepID=UPI0013DCDB7D|nr:thioesterase domain-containing protein [Streptomyces sp. OM5714]
MFGGGAAPGRSLSRSGPVVVIHPGVLPTEDYQELSAALPSRTDLYVVDLERVPEYFQAALSGGHTDTTVLDVASRIADELRVRGLVVGPWTLAGWSFGGVVAHALTAILTESELPRRTVLFDSIAPVAEYTRAEEEIGLDLVLPWFCMYLAAKRGADVPVPREVLAADDAGVDDALEAVLKAALEHGALRPGTTLPGLRKVYDTYLDGLRRNNRLAAGFEPARSRVPITLLRPERGLLATPDPLGWEQLSDDLSVEATSGDHYSMLSDPVAMKSAALAAVPAGQS